MNKTSIKKSKEKAKSPRKSSQPQSSQTKGSLVKKAASRPPSAKDSPQWFVWAKVGFSLMLLSLLTTFQIDSPLLDLNSKDSFFEISFLLFAVAGFLCCWVALVKAGKAGDLHECEKCRHWFFSAGGLLITATFFVLSLIIALIE